MTSVDWSNTGVVARVRKELEADESALVQQCSMAHPALVHKRILPPIEINQPENPRCPIPSGHVSSVHTSVLEKCFQSRQSPRGTKNLEKKPVSQQSQSSVFKDANGNMARSVSQLQNTVEQSRVFQRQGDSFERNGELQPQRPQHLFCYRPFTYGLVPTRKDTCCGSSLHTLAKSQQLINPRCPPTKRFSFSSKPAHVQRNYLENIVLLQSLVRRLLVRSLVKSECLYFTLFIRMHLHLCYSWERTATRGKISREICETEETYVKSLEDIITVFIDPLQRALEGMKPIISGEDVSLFAKHFHPVIAFNTPFLLELRKRVSCWHFQTRLADLFTSLDNKTMIEVYARYTLSCNAILDRFTFLCQTNKAFHRFVLVCLFESLTQTTT